MRDMEHQRQIIDTFVNSVYVFDDRVVLNFNFTDDSKTISREEVLGSSAVENAPPQKSSDFRLRIFCLVAVQDSNRAALTTPVGRVSNQPSGLLLSPRFPTPRNVYQERCRQTIRPGGFFSWWMVQDENRNEQRQGITMVVVSCLLLFLIEYGILGSVQQICIWRIESCGMN